MNKRYLHNRLSSLEVNPVSSFNYHYLFVVSQLHVSDEIVVQMTGYLIKAIQRCQSWAIPDILRTLASLVYENVDKIEMVNNSLSNITEKNESEAT